MEEITIPFKPVKDLQGPFDYYEEVMDAYTGKYLEELGVQPTAKLQRYVARRAPLQNCQIEAAWGESASVVVDQISITQPRSIQPLELQGGQGVEKSRADNALFSRVAQKNLHYMNTGMPEFPADGLGSLLESEEPQLFAKRLGDADFMSIAVSNMQMEDAMAGKANNRTLTQELERIRAQVRPIKPSDNEDKETETEQRDRRAKDLERLKRQFILPYACEKPKPAADRGTRIVPWQHLQMTQNIKVPEELRAEALEPILVTLDEIKEQCTKFASSMPLELLTNRDDRALFAPVRSQLVFSEAVRLTGLLSHLLYWVVFRHLHPEEKHLPEASHQSLLVTVHDLWSALIEPYRGFPMGVSLVIPAFFLSIKQGILWVFTSRYPSVFANDELCKQLTDQINVLFMQLFDPDCVYARFGVLDSTKQAMKLWRKLDLALASQGQGATRRMITRKNRTTPALNTLLGAECTGRPGHSKTRRLLAKSASDPSIGAGGPAHTGASKAASKGGAGAPNQSKRLQMDELKQEALFKVACKNLSRKGVEALPTGPGAHSASRVLARAASAIRLEGRGASLNGRRRRSLRVLAGRGASPVRDKRPTTTEMMQRMGKP